MVVLEMVQDLPRDRLMVVGAVRVCPFQMVERRVQDLVLHPAPMKKDPFDVVVLGVKNENIGGVLVPHLTVVVAHQTVDIAVDIRDVDS